MQVPGNVGADEDASSNELHLVVSQIAVEPNKLRITPIESCTCVLGCSFHDLGQFVPRVVDQRQKLNFVERRKFLIGGKTPSSRNRTKEKNNRSDKDGHSPWFWNGRERKIIR